MANGNVSKEKSIKTENNEDLKFQLFTKNNCNLQNLITKISVLRHEENIIFWNIF